MGIIGIVFLIWLPFFCTLAVKSGAEAKVSVAASEGTNVTSIDLERFFVFAMKPGDDVPSGKVVVAACAFLIQSVLKVTADQGANKLVSDVEIALNLCSQASLRDRLGDRTPREILSLFLNVLTTSPAISHQNLLTDDEIAAYVNGGGQPTYLFVAGPTAAGKSFLSSSFLSAVFAQDALLSESSLFIQLDNDNVKPLIAHKHSEKAPESENKAVKHAAARFLELCRVTYGTGSRGTCKDGVVPPELQQVYSPAAGYRSLLLLLMASQQTVTCNAHSRAVIDGKIAAPQSWNASMNGIKTVLGHISESQSASPVWVLFNELVAICGHGGVCSNGDSDLGIAAFCAKYAYTLAEADFMQRQFVSLPPIPMKPSDLLEILDRYDVNYLQNLKHKASTTLPDLKPLVLPTTCTQSANVCEIMSIHGQPATSPPGTPAGGRSGFWWLRFGLCVFGALAASGYFVYTKNMERAEVWGIEPLLG